MSKQFVRVESPDELKAGDVVRVRRTGLITTIKTIAFGWYRLAEVDANYNDGVPRFLSNLIGYWELDKEVEVEYKLPPVPKKIYVEEEKPIVVIRVLGNIKIPEQY